MIYNEHRAQSTEHRAQSTEHRAQSTEHRAQSTEHRALLTFSKAVLFALLLAAVAAGWVCAPAWAAPVGLAVHLLPGDGNGTATVAHDPTNPFSDTFSYGTLYTLPGNEYGFTPPDDKPHFAGWKIEGSGLYDDTVYSAGDVVQLTGDIYATAQWTATPPATSQQPAVTPRNSYLGYVDGKIPRIDIVDITLSVEATGTNLSYQWYLDGKIISEDGMYDGAVADDCYSRPKMTGRSAKCWVVTGYYHDPDGENAKRYEKYAVCRQAGVYTFSCDVTGLDANDPDKATSSDVATVTVSSRDIDLEGPTAIKVGQVVPLTVVLPANAPSEDKSWWKWKWSLGGGKENTNGKGWVVLYSDAECTNPISLDKGIPNRTVYMKGMEPGENITVLVRGNAYNDSNPQCVVTVNKGTPTSADFEVTLPSNLTYDGEEKTATATVKDSAAGIGTPTVKYYDSGGNGV